MTDRPLIAVARARALDDYVASIRLAGGEPWIVTPGEQSPTEIAARADGLLLLGGADVDPARYGESPHPTTEMAEPGRDTFEIALVRQAVAFDLPLLAICRGLQVMNVALGGSLIQDIPTQHAGALAHALDPQEKATRPPEQWKARVAHAISMTPESRLAALLPEAAARDVNSRHHQAVKQIGDELRVSAEAPDGIIEALERPASTFLLGVQWHPENFVDEPEQAASGGRFLGLFRGLVRAAGDRARDAMSRG